mgnify:CR=1 FL=1
MYVCMNVCMYYKVLLGGPVFKNVDHSVAFPPVEKFHNLKQRKKSLISGAKLKTFEKHISNSILNMVIFENWSKMD